MKKIMGWMRICGLILAILTLFPTMAFANSAAPEQAPDTGSIRFSEDSGITLLHETLEATLDPGYDFVDYHVVYTFATTGDDPVTRTLWFIMRYGDVSSLHVMIDGEETTVEPLDLLAWKIENWPLDQNAKYVTPWDQTEISGITGMYYGPEQQAIPVGAFELSLRPGYATEVTVDYRAQTGYIRKNAYFSPLSTAWYDLSPAAFYDGNAEVDLTLNVPKTCMVGSNLPLEQIGEGTYRLDGYGIGQDDWALTFLDRSELLFGTNDRTKYYRVLQVLLVIWILAALIRWKKPVIRKLSLTLLVMTLLAFLVRPTYGMMFMLIIISPVVAAIAITAAVVLVIKKGSKKNGSL